MIEFIIYNILKFINIILMPELWIRFVTVPLIIIIIAIFIEYFRKNNSINFFIKIFQTIMLSVGVYIIILGLVVTSKEALYERINQKQIIKLLLNDKNQKVYIDNKISIKSDKIIETLISLQSISAHHSHSNSYMPISLSVLGDKNYLQFKLYKDSQFNYEYWVYFFHKKEKKYIYIGRIHTDIFMSKKEQLVFQRNQEEKETKQIKENNKLNNWKVILFIGCIFLLISLLIYDGYFRSAHFKTTKKYFFWILFVLTLGIFSIAIVISLFNGVIMFFLIVIIIFLTIKNILSVFFCKECYCLERKDFFSKKKICSNCEVKTLHPKRKSKKVME